MGNAKAETISRPRIETMIPADLVAIIPARGGSKGIPKKNLTDLNGRPLISYSIEAALHCPFIHRCIVSTEDEQIKNISLQWGAEVIDRPDSLSTDVSLTQDVVEHVLDVLQQEGELPDYFVLLQPTSPLRNASHIESCIEQFFAHDAACAISVTEAEHHPYKMFFLDDEQSLQPFRDEATLSQPRQLLPKVYRQNGAIYLMNTSLFLEKKSFFAQPAYPFVMSNEESIDIDTKRDLDIAAFYLRNELIYS
ncbi:acylneuraminate cytidylyltransferase family protein [Fodinisporobacter ferrooxydans]|uniref:Acylneuraminate cytidylyltransferase family protein n=1 Tax=Fodinisporobacter ferrooxydans TaxID=2901836 RepID=A0ABY4CPN6_9BACL|nr:acylneuraminate cytidylyltransferase family protein [Alicyclobacillaceae bacterium MYW30-H2]